MLYIVYVYWYGMLAAAGPRLWNSLPADLRQADISFEQFKRLLKTFLFGCWDRGALWLTVNLRLISSLTYLLTGAGPPQEVVIWGSEPPVRSDAAYRQITLTVNIILLHYSSVRPANITGYGVAYITLCTRPSVSPSVCLSLERKLTKTLIKVE